MRVGKNELGAEGHVIVIQGAAIKKEQSTCTSLARAELIQDAATHAHKVVLGRLCRLDQNQIFKLTNAVGEEPREELGGGHLHSGRAGNPGTGRHAGREERLESGHLYPKLPQLVDNSDHVIRPRLVSSLLLSAVNGEGHYNSRKTIRCYSTRLVVKGTTSGHNVLVDRAREDVPLVVIGVVAEHLGAARSHPESRWLGAVSGHKAADGGIPESRGQAAPSPPATTEALEAT
mmetsp:Transcript_113532/g.316183  ORF Transcript_113532/g.316183 Transcript_113532/m.316183 type:complete len:232 (+) Transcript_113532:601-1296(+)